MTVGAEPAHVPAATVDELRAERDFLLRSLDDLDAELAAGELTPERHRSLSDRYTARAADVLRLLSAAGGAEPAPAPPGPPVRRRARRWPVAAALAIVG
ncbi:MAG: hypothetical protein ACRDIW_02130, partial [Actinomycetota bacterium]